MGWKEWVGHLRNRLCEIAGQWGGVQSWKDKRGHIPWWGYGRQSRLWQLNMTSYTLDTYLSLVYPQMIYPTMLPLQNSWCAIVGFLSFSHTQWCCTRGGRNKSKFVSCSMATWLPYVWRKRWEEARVVVDDRHRRTVTRQTPPSPTTVIRRYRQVPPDTSGPDQCRTVMRWGGKYEYCDTKRK